MDEDQGNEGNEMVEQPEAGAQPQRRGRRRGRPRGQRARGRPRGARGILRGGQGAGDRPRRVSEHLSVFRIQVSEDSEEESEEIEATEEEPMEDMVDKNSRGTDG